jgi:hypothetical protein
VREKKAMVDPSLSTQYSVLSPSSAAPQTTASEDPPPVGRPAASAPKPFVKTVTRAAAKAVWSGIEVTHIHRGAQCAFADGSSQIFPTRRRQRLTRSRWLVYRNPGGSDGGAAVAVVVVGGGGGSGDGGSRTGGGF